MVTRDVPPDAPGTSRVVAIVLALALAGCEPPPCFETMPHQKEAVQAIWWDFFHADREPPTIEWITGDRLTCGPDSTGFEASDHSGCAWGTFGDRWDIKIAWWPGAHYTERGRFTHELLHALFYAQGRNDNWNHSAPEFLPGGFLDRAARVLEQVQGGWLDAEGNFR